MRTFVVSDAHGCPEVLLNALGHGRFEPGRDAFVCAGDLLDRGTDVRLCISLVERYATEVLLGNHEVAALFGFKVFPQNKGSRQLAPFLRERVLAGAANRAGRASRVGGDVPSSRSRGPAWKVATSVEGVLITHAGVSEEYDPLFVDECACDAGELSARLNDAFLALVTRTAPLRDWTDDELLGESGPFWFRPPPYSHLAPLTNCSQVAGHTLPLASVEGGLFHMIEPTPWDFYDDPTRFRYAVIEDGAVTVADGNLSEREQADAYERLMG